MVPKTIGIITLVKPQCLLNISFYIGQHMVYIRIEYQLVASILYFQREWDHQSEFLRVSGSLLLINGYCFENVIVLVPVYNYTCNSQLLV